jgi:hypothetical protein
MYQVIHSLWKKFLTVSQKSRIPAVSAAIVPRDGWDRSGKFCGYNASEEICARPFKDQGKHSDHLVQVAQEATRGAKSIGLPAISLPE